LLWVQSFLFKIDIEMTYLEFVVKMVLNLVFFIYQKHGSSNIQCSIQKISRWGKSPTSNFEFGKIGIEVANLSTKNLMGFSLYQPDVFFFNWVIYN
jgi:hypothetical protein